MTHPSGGFWLAPDARSVETASPVAPSSTVEREPGPEVPSPVPLRPMTVADILDGGIAVIKAAPRSVFVIAATFVLPIELLSAWLQRDSLAESGLGSAFTAATSSSGSSDLDITGATVLLFVLNGLVLSLVTCAIAHLVSSWYADHAPTAGDAIRASLRRAPALISAWFVVHAAEGVAAIALLLPGLFIMPMFIVVVPAIAIERLGPWAGVRRAWRLTRVRYGPMLGAGTLIAMVSSALTIALSGLGFVFSFLSFGWIIDAVCLSASALITVPFVAAATTLVYLDLRIRAEGLDLELDIAEHFHGG